MKRRRICSLLGIDLPVLQGGMLWLAGAELAAAILRAGALGVLSPLAQMAPGADPLDNFASQISRLRELGGRPAAVNIPLDLEYSGLLIDVALRHKVDIVITAAGDPWLYTGILKNAGATVLHVAASVRQALRAQDAGADAVIAAGYEAAAHIGKRAEPLLALIPQVTEALSIPVVAAGGICDGRGMAAALALGAEGVQLGTRFVAVAENPAHANYKRALVDAATTVVTCRNLLPTRSLKTPFAEQLIALEASSAASDRIQAQLGFRQNRQSQLEGDLSQGELYAGAAVGLIRSVPPAGEVVKNLIRSYNDALARLVAL